MNLEKTISRYIFVISVVVFSVILCLLILGNIFRSYSLFNLNQEQNIPTWFSGQLLFAVAIMAGVNYVLSRHLKNSSSKVFKKCWVWLLIALLFLFLSMDEIAHFHERLEYRACALFAKGPIYGTWMIIYIPVFLFGIMLLTRFLRFIYKKERTAFVLGSIGAILWMFSFGSEFVEQFCLKDKPLCQDVYSIVVIVEEGLEMLGTAFFLLSLLLIAKGIVIEVIRNSSVQRIRNVISNGGS